VARGAKAAAGGREARMPTARNALSRPFARDIGVGPGAALPPDDRPRASGGSSHQAVIGAGAVGAPAPAPPGGARGPRAIG